LRRLVAYGRKVYGLRELLASVEDKRRRPPTPASRIANIVFFCGLLRVRSFNALEPKLKELSFRRLVGAVADQGEASLCSIDVVSRSLCAMPVSEAAKTARAIMAKAERNKVFREGWIGGFRFAAIDGWEPFASYDRHCPQCLARDVSFKQTDGSVQVRTQYYHRYVVAMLIDKRLDLLLDFEPQLPADQRPDGKQDAHEGEQTAALRLLKRLKKTFHWLDVVVADALYANGPFLTEVDRLKMSAIVVVKKETDEPLKEALSLWRDTAPEKIEVVDHLRADGRPDGRERHEFRDCRDLETLDTYKGRIRVVRAQVTRVDGEGISLANTTTWCMLVTGIAARRLSCRQILAAIRGRWHIENTGFHQWTTCWEFNHVFTHAGIDALFWLFFAAYNLLTLFLYIHIRTYGRDRGKDVTRTLSRFVDQLRDGLACLAVSPWDTS